MQNSKRELRLVVAGGGTGGHLFPGIAIAKRVCETHLEAKVLFIGTEKAFEKREVEKAGFLHTVAGASGIKGLGWRKKLRSAVKLPLSVVGCMVKLMRFRADAVVGVGGFSSGPVILAAWLLRRPVVLHEQNSVPGIANRISARFAKHIFLTYPESAAWFDGAKCSISGNPVRPEIIEAAKGSPSPSMGQATLLVVGGSQGAVAINRAVTDASPEIKAMGLRLIHQCGEADCERVRTCYNTQGADAEALPFIYDMAGAFQKATIVLCRAGATTLAELTAMGKPSILIPFPHAADNHQEKNARHLEKAGAARVVLESELHDGRLATELKSLLGSPDALSAMANAAQSLGRPHADREVADGVLRQITRFRP